MWDAVDVPVGCHIVLGICHSSWDNVYKMRLGLEWFRLHGGQDPSNLVFTIPFIQAQWEQFTRDYRTGGRSGNPQGDGDDAKILAIWLRTQVDALTLKRRLLQ